MKRKGKENMETAVEEEKENGSESEIKTEGEKQEEEEVEVLSRQRMAFPPHDLCDQSHLI